MTINRAGKLLGATHRAASMTIDRLVATDVLQEVRLTGRTRLFLAGEIIAVAEGAASPEPYRTA